MARSNHGLGPMQNRSSWGGPRSIQTLRPGQTDRGDLHHSLDAQWARGSFPGRNHDDSPVLDDLLGREITRLVAWPRLRRGREATLRKERARSRAR